MDLKERLIKEVALELGLSEELCSKVIDHEFNAIKFFIHSNPIGEVHIPRIGRLVATEKAAKRVYKDREDILTQRLEKV